MGKNPACPYNGLFASWVIDGKTRETNSIPAGPYQQTDKIQVSFVVVQNPGHFNLHRFGAYDLFQDLRCAGELCGLVACRGPGSRLISIASARHSVAASFWSPL
ncbi:MAG: hypothetical protein ACLQFR_05745 [Streptosporangiaceae bacterium]